MLIVVQYLVSRRNVEPDNYKNNEKEKQLAKRRDVIKKVIDWLIEEGLEPQEITHLRKDACYYGVVISEKQKKQTNMKNRDERFFTFILQLIGLIV